MAMYTTQPRRGRDPFDLDEYVDKYREAYSIAEITFMDGTKHEFMVKASPSVVPHLTKEMSNTGFLTLWNDTDTMCIRADQVKHFSMRQVTTNEGTNK
jgi:hypothetical protein